MNTQNKTQNLKVTKNIFLYFIIYLIRKKFFQRNREQQILDTKLPYVNTSTLLKDAVMVQNVNLLMVTEN